MKEISNEFYHAFCRSGSLVIDCEYCGRTYFGTGGDYEGGELERLESKAAKDPDKYRQVHDFTNWFTFNGKQCVVGCVCESDVKIEALLWANRLRIAEFLTKRSAAELKAATEDNETVQQLAQLAKGTQ